MKSAHVYAQRFGWSVIPLHDISAGHCSCSKGEACPSGGKHPRLNDWAKLATNDLEEIAEWQAQFPNANIGIATGSASGFFVLDVDPDHGGDETLEALEAEHGELPETVKQETGSGGFHYLFELPSGMTITNTAGKLGKGLDTRGDGGQIVVAPSVSAKGPYRWVNSPFTNKVAQAPAWLVSELKITKAKASTSTPGASSVNRGFFPAASERVLEQARAALAVVGPAVDGEGGGLKTIAAAALITHDFALTEDEAWPLLCEWNETCRPPWELEGPDSLRVMLHRGMKYGKENFGSKRTLDSIHAWQRGFNEFQSRAVREPAELLAFARSLRFEDRASRATMIADLRTVCAGAVKDLQIPEVVNATPVPAGAIVVGTRISQTADEALEAIKKEVYQRAGVLCEVVSAGEGSGQRTAISDMETARLQDVMSACNPYVRVDTEKGPIEQVAPLAVAQVLHARRQHPDSIRILESVTTAPIFLADGSILQERGYNAAARVFLQPSVSVFVLDDPTIDDAYAAVGLFKDLLCDFNFLEPADFSTWLAGLLSPLVKSATANAPAPLFCVSASTPGAGKTLLTEVIARIVTGTGPEVRPYNPRDTAEWQKRVTSFVKSGAPVNVLDNVNGPMGDETLDRLITSSVWSDRILGASEAPPLPVVGVFYATGNNIEPQGDTVRRCAFVRLDIQVERPQERKGFKRPMLADYAAENRSELLSAALTILRAYHLAGRPDQRLEPWGSFSTWSNLVRAALVWAGCADPYLTQRRAAVDLSEPENEAHDFWISVVDSTDGAIASVCATANQRNAPEVLALRDPVTPHSLKKLINRFVDKPRAGRRLRRVRDHRGVTSFMVELVSA